jgi:ABC-type Mn2+/Zn2+ transport system ATPase subunit
MKLKRITLLSEYKNIQIGGTLDFSTQNYTTLVGANGSGKSNWIEVVASVMLHLLENRDPGFAYRFSLDEQTEVKWQGGNMICTKDGNVVGIDTLDLPKKLIACYSGEDQRLWNNILMDSYAHYFSATSISHVEEPAAIYVNKYQWAIAFIVLMCSQNPEVQVFVNELWNGNIPLEQIQVKIDLDDVPGYDDPDTRKILGQIQYYEQLSMKEVQSFDVGVDPTDNEAFCKRLYYLLYALSMPVVNSRRGIQIQKAIKEIKIETSNNLSLTGLSEGHKKRILIMLMTYIIGDNDTFYLLDEPDAHVDVAAKSKILGLIEKAPGHVLMTTHSPLMTRNMKPDSVQTVKEGNVNKEEWKIVIEHLADNQFASVDNFLFTLKRRVVISEGKTDVYYIREAVRKLKGDYPELEKLTDVAFFSMGGTGETEYFLENSLEPVMSYLDKVVILFDKDGAGESGYTETLTFRSKGYESKIEVFKYARQYPDPEPDKDYFVEDYFSPASYVGTPNIVGFNLNGQPPYYEMKKMAQQSSAIKKFLGKNYQQIDKADYVGFLPLLHEIINKLGL